MDVAQRKPLPDDAYTTLALCIDVRRRSLRRT
jgi:hypothetical protein